jgi:plasmid stabilization system protein ParE
MKWTASISGRAEADVTNQYRWYFDNAGVKVAEGFLLAFDATVNRLVSMPTSGRSRRFRAAELQGLRSRTIASGYGSHLIFYRIIGNTISVERVMHGARSLEERLVESPEQYPLD